jgi:hypothetical protein
MKKCLLFLIFSCGILSAVAQQNWYYFAEEFYFVKEVTVKDMRGKNFRYEIAVKANPADTLSKVRIHGIAVGKGKEDFINSDFTVESRTEQDWTVYTVVGKVQEDAWRLWFYAAVNGNGDFHFDDLSFYIEMAPGSWKQLRLFNPSFEERNKDIFSGYYVSKRNSANTRTSLSTRVYKTGTHSLKVKSVGQVSVSLISSTGNQSN